MKCMELKEAIERIAAMEQCFDTLQNAVEADPAVLREDSFQEKLQELVRYYEGGQWLQDYALDERGLLPGTLKRGVLSEDGVYNFLAQLTETEEYLSFEGL